MIVSVKRSGGFAGSSEELARIDAAQLAGPAAHELERAMHEICFFDLPAEIAPEQVGADMFRYEVTAEDRGRAHTVACQGTEAPEDARVRRLVETVMRLAGGNPSPAPS